MNKMKLAFLLSISVVLGLVVVACGSTSTPEPVTVVETVVVEVEVTSVPDEAAPAEPAEPTEPAEQEAEQEPVELTFVNWIGAEEATADDMEAMLAAFEEKYPYIKVNSVTLPWGEMGNQLLVMALGGDAPDVSMVHTLWVGPLLEAGVLAPLNDILPNQDDYFPSTFQGKYVGDDLMYVTWAPSPIVLYYNYDLLEQAGYDGPPKTFDEMIQMAYDVAALGDDIFGIPVHEGAAGNAGFYFLGNYMWNQGGQLFDENGNVAVNTPENVKAFTLAQQLANDKVTPDGLILRDFRDLFSQGKIGFHFDGEFGVGIIKNFSDGNMILNEDYGVTLVPGPDPETPGESFFIEHQLAVYKDSEHKKEAALLIDFLTGPEGMAIYNEHGGTKLPARKSTAEIDFYKAEENSFMNTFIEQLAVARPLPGENPQFKAMMVELAKAVQQVTLVGDDPATVLENLQRTLEALQGQ